MDGFRTLITFKNSYAVTKNNKLIFSRPKNNEFALLCIEKGYAVAKSDKKTITKTYTKNTEGEGENLVLIDANTLKTITLAEINLQARGYRILVR